MDIKKIIKNRGLTLTEVGQRMGISQSGVSQLLNGNITLSKLREIADAIGCKVGDFFADETSSPTDSATLSCPHCGKPIHLEVKHQHQ